MFHLRSRTSPRIVLRGVPPFPARDSGVSPAGDSCALRNGDRDVRGAWGRENSAGDHLSRQRSEPAAVGAGAAAGGRAPAVANRGAAGGAHRVREPPVEEPAVVAARARDGAAERRRSGGVPAGAAQDIARRLGWREDERVVLFNAGHDSRNKRLDLAQSAVEEARRWAPSRASGGARRQRRAGASSGPDERRGLPAGDQRCRGIAHRGAGSAGVESSGGERGRGRYRGAAGRRDVFARGPAGSAGTGARAGGRPESAAALGRAQESEEFSSAADRAGARPAVSRSSDRSREGRWNTSLCWRSRPS